MCSFAAESLEEYEAQIALPTQLDFTATNGKSISGGTPPASQSTALESSEKEQPAECVDTAERTGSLSEEGVHRYLEETTEKYNNGDWACFQETVSIPLSCMEALNARNG